MEKPVILIIADISGYTRFITSNIETTTHSQAVVTELVETIIKQVEIPLEVAKLEGDAVFLYSVKENSDTMSWNDKRMKIGEKLITFFETFTKKVVELSMSTLCECDACKNISMLRLKIIVHSGKAVFHRIGKFEELGGVDAIVVHRLLKNSLKSNEYILLTEAGYNDIEFPEAIEVTKGTEQYDEIGIVKTVVFYPTSTKPEYRAHLEEATISKPFSERYRTMKGWNNKIWFRSLALAIGLRKTEHYNNLNVEYKFFPRIGEALYRLVTFPYVALAKKYMYYVKIKNEGSHPHSHTH